MKKTSPSCAFHIKVPKSLYKEFQPTGRGTLVSKEASQLCEAGIRAIRGAEDYKALFYIDISKAYPHIGKSIKIRIPTSRSGKNFIRQVCKAYRRAEGEFVRRLLVLAIIARRRLPPSATIEEVSTIIKSQLQAIMARVNVRQNWTGRL